MVQILKLKLERDTDCPSVKDDLQVCKVKYTVYLKYQHPPCVLHFTLKKNSPDDTYTCTFMTFLTCSCLSEQKSMITSPGTFGRVADPVGSVSDPRKTSGTHRIRNPAFGTTSNRMFWIIFL